MGNTASISKEAVVDLAKGKVNFSPPLGTPNPENPKVFFDIALGRYGDAVPLGRIVMELKQDVVPKTAENFLQLCTSTQQGFGYKNSRFHRVIPNFMCQVGVWGGISSLRLKVGSDVLARTRQHIIRNCVSRDSRMVPPTDLAREVEI
jgi:hypothetical protein